MSNEFEKVEVDTQKESTKLSKKEQKELAKKQHEELVASMTKEEYEIMQLEEMRYQNNKLSHMLGYLGVACSLLACFFSLPCMEQESSMQKDTVRFYMYRKIPLMLFLLYPVLLP